MSVKIETATLSMSDSLDSLKETPLVMHRIWFELKSVDAWYAIMKEARAMYGNNWQGRPKVKRKLENMWWGDSLSPSVQVWFDVPDPAFATWISVKHAVIAIEPPGKYDL